MADATGVVDELVLLAEVVEAQAQEVQGDEQGHGRAVHQADEGVEHDGTATEGQIQNIFYNRPIHLLLEYSPLLPPHPTPFDLLQHHHLHQIHKRQPQRQHKHIHIVRTDIHKPPPREILKHQHLIKINEIDEVEEIVGFDAEDGRVEEEGDEGGVDEGGDEDHREDEFGGFGFGLGLGEGDHELDEQGEEEVGQGGNQGGEDLEAVGQQDAVAQLRAGRGGLLLEQLDDVGLAVAE